MAQEEVELYKFINTLKVSEGWKRTFKVMHLVYHRNYFDGNYRNVHFWTALPEISALGFGQKTKFFCTFNFWALFFGPLYYFAKGLYVKGLALIGVMWLLYIFDNSSAALMPLVMLYCAVYANADYFIKTVLKSSRVQEDPMILEESFDNDYFDAILQGPNTKAPIAFVGVFIGFMMFLNCGFGAYHAFHNSQALNRIPPFCKGDCQQVLQSATAEMNAAKKKSKFQYKVACIYALMRDQKSAMKFINLSIKGTPRFAPAYILKAMIHTDLAMINPESQESVNHYRRAIDNYKTALRTDKKLVGANYNIGQCQYKTRHFENALASFKLATKRYPFRASFFEMQGYTKVYLKDVKGAKKDLKRAAFLYSLNFISPDKNRTEALKRYIKML